MAFIHQGIRYTTQLFTNVGGEPYIQGISASGRSLAHVRIADVIFV